MSRYVVRRILGALPTLVLASIVISSLREFVSDEQLVGRMSEGYVTDWPTLLHALEVGESFPERYFSWLAGTLQGDLGRSDWTGQEVRVAIAVPLLQTGLHTLTAIAIAGLTVVPLAVWSVLHRGRREREVAAVVSVTGRSFPEFWLASLVLYPLATSGTWRPESFAPVWEYGDPPPVSLLPVLCITLIAGWRFGGAVMQPLRLALVDVLEQDHVESARAKGLRERAVLVRHVLRNAVPAALAILGAHLPALIGVVLVTEIALGVSGTGWVVLGALKDWDFPMIRGFLLAIVVAIVGTNLVLDVAGAALDPRIAE